MLTEQLEKDSELTEEEFLKLSEQAETSGLELEGKIFFVLRDEDKNVIFKRRMDGESILTLAYKILNNTLESTNLKV